MTPSSPTEPLVVVTQADLDRLAELSRKLGFVSEVDRTILAIGLARHRIAASPSDVGAIATIRLVCGDATGDPIEARARFIEEAHELAQAAGASLAEVEWSARGVFAKPADPVALEVGQVVTALHRLAFAHGVNVAAEAERDRLHIEQNADAIRDRHARKARFDVGARPIAAGEERAQWPKCACKEPPFDDEVVYDRNLSPRCPRCNTALGGDPLTATERAERDAEDPIPTPQTEPTIPAGMKPWAGGDSAPKDWDGGSVYRRALGVVKFDELDDPDLEWEHHAFGRLHELDIIAYTPKAQTEPLSSEGVSARAKLVSDLDRHASALYRDMAQSDLWATLIAARDALSRQSPSEGQEAVLVAALELVKPTCALGVTSGECEAHYAGEGQPCCVVRKALKQAGGDQ